jgi:hypothetical protein
MKPRWELLHDWWIEDLKFQLWQIWEFKKLLRKHPDDDHSEWFREMIKRLKKQLTDMVKRYEKIYGDKPDIAVMRREVEND